MAAGLTTHMSANDHVFLPGVSVESFPLPAPADDPPTALRECDEIREILTPRVFHAVRQQDNAFWRKRFNSTFIMGNEHYRAAEAPQGVENLFAAGRIQVVRRLVKQQDVSP